MEVEAPPCWSNILRQQPPPQQLQQPQCEPLFAQNLVGSCSSAKGIAVAVVDANAIIQGGERLFHSANRFVSVAEVITEIRDPASRHSLHFLPLTVDTLEPSPDALTKVVSFARATGDLQTLSDVDLKLIALAYTLESQIHGTQHLRDSPPAIHAVNVKRLPERDLPGWGSNVPNLEEWKALEHADDNGSYVNSRIFPLRDLSLGTIPEGQACIEDASSQDGRSCTEYQEDENNDGSFENSQRCFPKEKEVKVDGKKMVVDGIDASLGQLDENADDWQPAVSRSTHRRFLRRKSRRETSEELSVQQESENLDDNICPKLLVDSGIEAMDSTSEVPQEDLVEITEELGNLNMASQTDEEINEGANIWHTYDISSEQSWTLKTLSESSVACITGDFAMQNVLLQMGLRLHALGGMKIRELHRWVLKCHACSKVTAEIGKIFCPTCGNGGTLRKVAVTVSDNGIVLAARRPRISLRGTKYSLPLPQGGREAITKNPILREDQLPPKLLYPKTKKKNNQENDLFIPDQIFLHHSKKASLQPPVRKALAVFSGKRNPNDIRYVPRKC